jgi:choline-sulfatase
MPPANILLIMSDQHRADTMGCAGNAVVQTPNLDRLAREGVRFARAYCQGPLCMPARASFLTERYVRDHGVADNDHALAPAGTPTFLHALRGAGYHTACIGKMHLYVHGGAGDTRAHADTLHALGFDESNEAVGKVASLSVRSPYSDFLRGRGLEDEYRRWLARRVPADRRAQPDADRERTHAWQCEAFPFPPDAYLDAWIGAEAVRWIETYDRDRPFFQWVGFAGPHNPWDAPQAYVDRYRTATPPAAAAHRPELPADGPYRRFLERALRRSESDGLTEETVREVRRAYYANVTLIDEQIGAILAALERRGLLENTWVVYTTDHGEMLGDHGLLFKTVFYEPSVRVPLIIRPPGSMAGRVVEDLVEQIDVPATLREAAGAGEVTASAGRSLRAALTPNPSPAVAGEGLGVRAVAVSQNYGFAAFITDRHKLIVWEETRAPVALFDLRDDPSEDRNVVADAGYAAVREDLMRRHAIPFLDGHSPVAAEAASRGVTDRGAV